MIIYYTVKYWNMYSDDNNDLLVDSEYWKDVIFYEIMNNELLCFYNMNIDVSDITANKIDEKRKEIISSLVVNKPVDNNIRFVQL